MMKAILILAGSYSSCITTQKIWQDECIQNDIALDIFDLMNKASITYIEKFNLKSFPALIIDNKVIAVGHPSQTIAKELLMNIKI